MKYISCFIHLLRFIERPVIKCNSYVDSCVTRNIDSRHNKINSWRHSGHLATKMATTW